MVSAWPPKRLQPSPSLGRVVIIRFVLCLRGTHGTAVAGRCFEAIYPVVRALAPRVRRMMALSRCVSEAAGAVWD